MVEGCRGWREEANWAHGRARSQAWVPVLGSLPYPNSKWFWGEDLYLAEAKYCPFHMGPSPWSCGC